MRREVIEDMMTSVILALCSFLLGYVIGIQQMRDVTKAKQEAKP